MRPNNVRGMRYGKRAPSHTSGRSGGRSTGIWDGTSRSHGDPGDVLTAALAERVKKYGESSDIVRYFKQRVDEDLPAGAPLLAKQDRAYNRAAAVFYQQRYDEAAALFEKVASDAQSPWRAWGAYLAGRSLLWHARSAMREADYDVRLRAATVRLRKVVDDPALASMHDYAERLLTRCLMKNSTKEGLERTGRRLLASRRTALRESDLFVYLDAYDEKLAPMDPLSLWIRAFQGRHLPSLERGWRETRNRAWLLALISVTASHRADLVDAALAVPESAPGAEAMHFHAARLLARHGEFDRARTIFDGLLKRFDGYPSARNRVSILRAQVAQTLQEFLALSAKPVLLVTSELDQKEWDREVTAPPLFDAAAVWQMYNSIPAALLEANIGALPNHMRDSVQLAVRTRKGLLNSPSDAFVLELLKTPKARPYPVIGVGRGLDDSGPDEMRPGWWTISSQGQPADLDTPYLPSANSTDTLDIVEAPPFVSAEQRQQARSEAARMPRSGYDFIANRVLAIVRREPRRADNPALLEAVIQNAGVSWWTSGNQSAAFLEALRLMRARYPNTREGRRIEEEFSYVVPR